MWIGIGSSIPLTISLSSVFLHYCVVYIESPQDSEKLKIQSFSVFRWHTFFFSSRIMKNVWVWCDWEMVFQIEFIKNLGFHGTNWMKTHFDLLSYIVTWNKCIWWKAKENWGKSPQNPDTDCIKILTWCCNNSQSFHFSTKNSSLRSKI